MRHEEEDSTAVTWAVISLGAMAGASLRYGVSRWVTAGDGHFPWRTLLVNVVGSFVLGLLVSRAAAGRATERTRHLVGTGFCGALTTFSTLALETVTKDAYPYLAVTLAAGFAAAWLGLRAGKRAPS